jgi:hypothetical protein
MTATDMIAIAMTAITMTATDMTAITTTVMDEGAGRYLILPRRAAS